MNLMTGPAPSFVATSGMVAIVAAVAVGGVAAITAASRAAGEDDEVTARRRSRATLTVGAWLFVTGALAASGRLAFGLVVPPPVMIVVAIAAVLSTTLALSSTGRLLAGHLPIAVLVGFQAFRFPLELVLHQLGLDGVLPVQMTYDGMNWDIATGVSAIVVGAWAALGRVPRVVLWLWNVLGLVLLAVIVTIAILSVPGPTRVFENEPANTIVATLPFVWLPTVLVQAAWIGHLLLFRRLFLERRHRTRG